MPVSMPCAQAGRGIYLTAGLVAVAYPVSALLTCYHMHIAEWTAYTNCVVDAPAVPFMADNRETVRHDE
jgi:hypothetical protein